MMLDSFPKLEYEDVQKHASGAAFMLPTLQCFQSFCIDIWNKEIIYFISF